MKDLIDKLPAGNAFLDFVKKYFAQIEELFNSIMKFFTSVFDKGEEAEAVEEEE